MGLNEFEMGLRELFGTYGGFMFPLPDIAGKYQGKNLAVCGDAACVWDDLETLGCKKTHGRGRVEKEGWDFMAVNKLGEVFPGNIEHWYSNEAQHLKKFVEARRQEYKFEFHGPNHTHSCNKGARWHWPWGGHGTSGLSAVLTGIGLGYDRIAICGIPLDDGPHNGEPPWRRCNFKREAPDDKDGNPDLHWRKAIQLAFDGNVQAMSGRPRQWISALS